MPEQLNQHFAERYSPSAELQETISRRLKAAEQARQIKETKVCWLILLGDGLFVALLAAMLWLFVGSGLWLTLAVTYGFISIVGCAVITLTVQLQSRGRLNPKMYSFAL